MTKYDVVKKLIGEIEPVGETNADDKRFENLKEMTRLVYELLDDIDNVAQLNKNSHEYSVKRASGFAMKFLDGLEVKNSQ